VISSGDVVKRLSIHVPGQGLHEVTEQVRGAVRESGLQEGLCTLFIQHTSASLTIQENADPSARRDLESWLKRLVPEHDPLYTHTTEGPDDMPSHIKAALTATSLSIPVVDGELGLGTWQGIFIWEHRRHASTRRLLVHVGD
jgi:secondary thiamine-phosphate synthase enzyme